MDNKESSITFDRLLTILIHKCTLPCSCSYCKGSRKDKPLHYGLNIPKDKSHNSWWVIKYGVGRYVRWTNDWLKSYFNFR